MRRKLVVEGWRHIHHSYALVAQSHCLHLLDRRDIDLRFHDLPYFNDKWRATRNIFSEEDVRLIDAIRTPAPSFEPEAIFSLRAGRPDFSVPTSGRRFVFGTPELRVLKEPGRGGLNSGVELPDTVSIVTPSGYSAVAYKRFDVPPERIHVVPHGFDPAVFNTDDLSREAERKARRQDDRFVFISVGAMTRNKGIELLTRAFANVVESHPDAQLVLKGSDRLYASHSHVELALNQLSIRAREQVISRMVYLGETLGNRDIASLLRSADCYVSPYLAEGFNLPVLEATACGLPVICTAGGPTDEFTDPSTTWRISSMLRRVNTRTPGAEILVPSVDHLTELMKHTVVNRDEARVRGVQAARFALRHFTWEAVTDTLIRTLLPK